MPLLKTISPIDGSVYYEQFTASDKHIHDVIKNANIAKQYWRNFSLSERADICCLALEYFKRNKEVIAEEITRQMGRPISQTPKEIDGLLERANYMIEIAATVLTQKMLPKKHNLTRFITREPWGTVFVISPWNYPYLTSINAIIPALMAGNTIILKPSTQTPLTGKHYVQAFKEAGLPENIFQILYLNHEQTEKIIENSNIHYVAFTGSVKGGEQIQKAAIKQFKTLGLELGGKDPAYVCKDAKLSSAVNNLVDGAFFNSGQSCCGIERIYVDKSIYKDFVERFTLQVSQYRLGNPLDYNINLGPVVNSTSACFIRKQINDAILNGAKALIDSNDFLAQSFGENYLAPQVLINVNHSMSVMKEESFGPVVGIMSVNSEIEAIKLMNDSPFGLTASIWTNDEQKAIDVGQQIETGTWFMNRCDYLDPALAWTGVKNSGRGVTLSHLGYEHLTQVKSYHLCTVI